MLYTFTPDELSALLAKVLAGYATFDGVHDFSDGYIAQDATVRAALRELELSYQARPAIEQENWLDEMIAEDERESLADDAQLQREIALSESIPFDGVAPDYETDDNINDLGLEPVA